MGTTLIDFACMFRNKSINGNERWAPAANDTLGGRALALLRFWSIIIATLDLFASDPFKIMLLKGGSLWKL